MFKKAFFKFVLLVMSIYLLTSCTGGNKVKLDPANPVTIVVWHYYHGAQKTAFDNAIKTFNETDGYEVGIIVEAVSYGGVDELAENVVAAAKGDLDAGDMPDIFGSYGDTALEILNMEMVAEIDEYIPASELEEYEESFIHEGRLGTDKLYVFPIAKSTESLMLNKTEFDAFAEGLAASGMGETVSYEDLYTWEGILKVADIYYRYTEAFENEGKAFLGIDSLANYLIVGAKQLGHDLVKVEDGSPVFDFDEETMLKLWNTYYDSMVTGRFTKLGKFCSDDIKTGDSLCFIGSTASASYFPTELLLDNGDTKSIEMFVLPMPVFENGDKVAVSQGAGMVIAKSVKEKEYASAYFLKWFTDAQRNVSFSLSSSYLPVKKDALDENLLNEAFSEINSEDVATQNSIKALKVAIEQLRGYTLYSSDVFDGGAAFREKLPEALTDAVQQDRIEYLSLIQDGLSADEAYQAMSESSSQKFALWLDSLNN